MAVPIWNDKESRWTLRIQRDGIARKFSSVKPGAAGKREVLRRAREWEGVAKADVSVLQAWNEFLADSKIRCRPSAYSSLKRYGEYYIIPKVGKHKLRSMTPIRWQNVINESKPIGRTLKSGKKIYRTDSLSKKTYENIRGTITTFCRFCIRSGYEITLPDALYVPRDAVKIGKGILTIDQIGIVLAASGPWYANSWKIMLLTGLRPGECYGLRTTDIKDGMLHVKRAIDPQRNITDGKTKNARRSIYLPDIAIPIIDDQMRQINKLQTDILFPNLGGELAYSSCTYRSWKRFATAHGIDVPLYSLRHTHATIMESKLSLGDLKAAMGHAESMDTVSTYVHETPEQKLRTAKVVDITFRDLLHAE